MTAADAGSPAVSRTRSNSFGDTLSRLSTKSETSSLDKVLRVAGPVLIPLGLLTIALGWYGASNTTRVFLQIPYLISGGVLGLALTFTGGFVYFARWMNDLVDDSRQQAADAREMAERTALALERIEARLASGATAAPADAPAPAEAPAAAPAIRVNRTQSDDLVITQKGSLVHRSSCRLVEGRKTKSVSSIGNRERCKICRPPAG